MARETLSIEQFPDVNWSRFVQEHADGYREFSFGLTRIRLNGELLQLTDEGLLVPCGAPIHETSSVFFGQADMRPTVKVLAQYQHPFRLEDASRINGVGTLTSEFLGTHEQMVTARQVIHQAHQLFDQLRLINMANPEVIREMGILEAILTSQATQLLPERSVGIAKRLKDLKVDKFGGYAFSSGTWTPDWVIENYLEKSQI
ncbi:MAG: hypothetical protein AAB414_02835 [Patescibacteria group bacterium]